MLATATEELLCECGFEAKTKSGLTNHKKKCKSEITKPVESRPVEPKPVEPRSVEPIAPKIFPSDPLTTSDRSQFTKRILDRKAAILTALGEELDGNPETILDTLRREKGVVLTVSQLNELIEGVDRQIEEEITDDTKDEEQRIKIAIADLDEAFEEKELALKDKHRQEVKALIEEKKDAKAKLTKELKDAKDKVIEAKAKDLVRTREKYKHDMLIARQVEQEIQLESQQRITLLKRSKGRLLHVINDATNRALEQLLTVRTREEAGDLIKIIPTVSEAINQCRTPNGFQEFMKRLDPTLCLPAPAVIDETKLKRAVEEVKEEQSEDKEDESDEQNTIDEHDEIYEELENANDNDNNHRRRLR